MKKITKILLPIALIATIAAFVLFGIVHKDDLASETGTIAKNLIDFVKNPSKTDKYVLLAFGGVFVLLAIIRAVRRRKNKDTSFPSWISVLGVVGLICYILLDKIKDDIKNADTLMYVSFGCFGFAAFLILLLALIPNRKLQKQPYSYKKSGFAIYGITMLFLLVAVLYFALAKNGFENLGKLLRDSYKYVFDYKKDWVQPRPKVVTFALISASVSICMFFALLKRKRNVLPLLNVVALLGVMFVYAMKYKTVNSFIVRSVDNGNVINNVLVFFVLFVIASLIVVSIFCLVDVLFALTDPNEIYIVQIDKKKSAEVKALAQEINDNDEIEEDEESEEVVEEEKPTPAPVQAAAEPEEEAEAEDEEEEDEEEEETAPAPKVVAKPASKNEYEDEDYDAYDDEEDEDDDEDEEEEEDEDDEDEEDDTEGADDAREALRRRRELIRQRILAARIYDDDDEDEVEEDEVIGYEDEDDDEDEDDEEIVEEEVVEEPVEEPVEEEVASDDEEEPEEELDEDEELSDVYNESVAFDDETELDEEEDDDEEEEEELDADEFDAQDAESLDDEDEEELEEYEEEVEAPVAEEEPAEELESDDDDEALDEDLDSELTDDGFDDDSESDDEDDDDEDEDTDDVPSDDNLDISAKMPMFGQGKSKPMKEKMATVLDDEKRDRYNAVRNELQSYRNVKERMSAKGDSYRFHRELIAKIDVGGKTLKLHLALNPDDFQGTKYAFQDLSAKSKYMYTPLTIKLTSGRSVKHSIELIGMVAQAFGLEKNPRYKEKDYASEILAEFESEKTE